MPKRYTGNLIVSWLDDTGKKQRKVYKEWSQAQKAARWLANVGAKEIDIASEFIEPQLKTV